MEKGMTIEELQEKTNEELLEMARGMGFTENGSLPKRNTLLMKVMQLYADQNGNVVASGILSIINEGYGFL